MALIAIAGYVLVHSRVLTGRCPCWVLLRLALSAAADGPEGL